MYYIGDKVSFVWVNPRKKLSGEIIRADNVDFYYTIKLDDASAQAFGQRVFFGVEYARITKITGGRSVRLERITTDEL